MNMLFGRGKDDISIISGHLAVNLGVIVVHGFSPHGQTSNQEVEDMKKRFRFSPIIAMVLR